jgi:hypothetical protein
MDHNFSIVGFYSKSSLSIFICQIDQITLWMSLEVTNFLHRRKILCWSL